MKRMQYSCRQLWSCSHLPWKVPARRWLSALRSHFKSFASTATFSDRNRPGSHRIPRWGLFDMGVINSCIRRYVGIPFPEALDSAMTCRTTTGVSAAEKALAHLHQAGKQEIRHGFAASFQRMPGAFVPELRHLGYPGRRDKSPSTRAVRAVHPVFRQQMR